MSLLNQVLRDLDKRQAPSAPAVAVKSAPRAAVPAARQRAGRWALGAAVTLAAVVAGGFAQGSLSWPKHAPVIAEANAAPIAVVTPAPAPVVAPVAVVAPPAPAPVVVATVEPVSTPPLLTALAAPTPRPHAPVTTLRVRPQVADAAPRATAPTPPATATALIDKRNAARTPRERAEANYQRGVAAHQSGLIDDSATAFLAALRDDPSYAPARQAQAGLLASQARLDEAVALLQEGLALTPQQPVLSLMLARLQADRQQLDAALDTLQAAAAQATQNPEYLGVHAAILQRAGRHADAAEKYGQALRLVPANSVWWMGLGLSLAATGHADSAREAFLRAKSTGGLPPEASLYVDARLKQLL